MVKNVCFLTFFSWKSPSHNQTRPSKLKHIGYVNSIFHAISLPPQTCQGTVKGFHLARRYKKLLRAHACPTLAKGLRRGHHRPLQTNVW